MCVLMYAATIRLQLIKCWFDNVPIMEIRRGNAAELVARGYFYKTM
jgi:hypothetical protein